MSTLSPNMNLVISTVGVDSGLLWEQNLNASEIIIDAHNHTPGKGVQIPPQGLNINGPLTFNGNPATNLSAVEFTSQTSFTALSSAYVGSDGNFYYNDSAGNVVQLTKAGAVNSTTSGIFSGTASASFVSSVLVVNQNTNTPANIQAGSILIGNNVSGSNFCTLGVQSSLAANYSITLPTLPSATRFISMDSSGNQTANGTGDGTTIQVTSGVIGVIAGGIGATQIANGAVGSAQIATNGVATANIAANAVTAAKLETAPTAVYTAINQTVSGSSTIISLGAATSTGTFTTGRPVYMVVTGLVDLFGISSGTYTLPNTLTVSFSLKFAGGVPQTYTLSSQSIDYAQVLNGLQSGGSFPPGAQIGSYPAQAFSQLIVTPVSPGSPQSLNTFVISVPSNVQVSLTNFQLAFFQV